MGRERVLRRKGKEGYREVLELALNVIFFHVTPDLVTNLAYPLIALQDTLSNLWAMEDSSPFRLKA